MLEDTSGLQTPIRWSTPTDSRLSRPLLAALARARTLAETEDAEHLALVDPDCVRWLKPELATPDRIRCAWPPDRRFPVAVVHTHPSGQAWPSYRDLAGQISMSIPWWIVPRGEGHFVVGGEPAALVGRPFRWGVTDCFSLLRDSAEQDGIVIDDVPRAWGFWKAGEDLFGEHLDRYGQIVSHDWRDARPGDVMLYRIRSKVWNHCGRVLNGGVLLHHPGGNGPYDPSELSRRAPLARFRLPCAVVRLFG